MHDWNMCFGNVGPNLFTVADTGKYIVYCVFESHLIQSDKRHIELWELSKKNSDYDERFEYTVAYQLWAHAIETGIKNSLECRSHLLNFIIHSRNWVGYEFVIFLHLWWLRFHVKLKHCFLNSMVCSQADAITWHPNSVWCMKYEPQALITQPKYSHECLKSFS